MYQHVPCKRSAASVSRRACVVAFSAIVGRRQLRCLAAMVMLAGTASCSEQTPQPPPDEGLPMIGPFELSSMCQDFRRSPRASAGDRDELRGAVPASAPLGSVIPSVAAVLKRVSLPLPIDLDRPNEHQPYAVFNNGECPSYCDVGGETEERCGGLHLIDAVIVDADGDGALDLVALVAVGGGGSIVEQRLLAWRWHRATSRFAFMADVAPSASLCNDNDWLSTLKVTRDGCVIAAGICGKTCHGCDGLPCRYTFSWSGSGFAEVAFAAERRPILARWEWPRHHGVLRCGTGIQRRPTANNDAARRL